MMKDTSRAFIKPLSEKLGRFFSLFGGPNFYSYLTLLTGFIAAYFILIGSFILGIAFILLSGFMDLLDGAVARATNKVTKWGAMLDSVIDKITEISIYFALAFYSTSLYLGATLAIASFMLSSYISKHAGAIGAKQGGGLLERKERIFLLIVGLLVIPINIEWMAYILYMITFFSSITALQRLNRTRKALKELKNE